MKLYMDPKDRNKDAKTLSDRIKVWVAWKLVAMAKWIYPQSEDVLSFYTSLISDELIYGKSVVRVNPLDMENHVKRDR